MSRLLISLALLGLAMPSGAATVRIGLVAGNNIGQSSEVPLQYAESDARRMRDLLVELGGFDPDRILLLLGKTKAEMEGALQQVRGRIAEATSRGDQALLLFYFSGHGGQGGLHLGNSALDLEKLRDDLKATGAAVVVGIVDACHSGRVGRAKGGVPDEAFDVTLFDEPTPRGTVMIASSLDDELSQESPQLRGSLFTHYLISALRGEADYDSDGRVTVREAYRSAYNRTLAKSATTSERRQHPTADIDISGKGELVLSFLKKSSAAIRFAQGSAGRYMIVDSRSGRVAAEIQKEAGRQVIISLPAGSYQIYKQERDEYLVCEVNLVWGGEHRLREDSMRRFPYQLIAQKGLHRRMLKNRLTVQGEVVDSLLPGMHVWMAGGLGYERFLAPKLSLGLALSYSRQDFTFDPGGDYLPLRTSHQEIRWRLSASYRVLQFIPALDPSVGLVFEHMYGWQNQTVDDDPEYRCNESFQMLGVGGQLGMEIKLPGRFTVLLWGRAMLAWTFLLSSEKTMRVVLVSNPSKSRQNILFFCAGLALAFDF
jgi:hypothetical protein